MRWTDLYNAAAGDGRDLQPRVGAAPAGRGTCGACTDVPEGTVTVPALTQLMLCLRPVTGQFQLDASGGTMSVLHAHAVLMIKMYRDLHAEDTQLSTLLQVLYNVSLSE